MLSNKALSAGVTCRKFEVHRKYYYKTYKGILYLGSRLVDHVYTNVIHNVLKLYSSKKISRKSKIKRFY
jgi:hypothetical protein